jgi:hypothetical protein
MSETGTSQSICDHCDAVSGRSMDFIVNFGKQTIKESLHYRNTTTLWDPVLRRYRICEQCIKSVRKKNLSVSLILLMVSILLSLLSLGFLFFVMVFVIAVFVVLAIPEKRYAAKLLRNRIFEDMEKAGFNIYKTPE